MLSNKFYYCEICNSKVVIRSTIKTGDNKGLKVCQSCKIKHDGSKIQKTKLNKANPKSIAKRKVERSDFGPNAGLVGSDVYEKQREASILEWQLELCDHFIGDGKQGAALLEQHVSLLFDLLSLLELAQQVEDVVDRILHRNLLQTALSRQIADICL